MKVWIHSIHNINQEVSTDTSRGQISMPGAAGREEGTLCSHVKAHSKLEETEQEKRATTKPGKLHAQGLCRVLPHEEGFAGETWESFTWERPSTYPM